MFKMRRECAQEAIETRRLCLIEGKGGGVSGRMYNETNYDDLRAALEIRTALF
jgi:hypothetical protein